ncbi:MAG: hypothetical protein ACFE85_17180 [Candidatus Hodarchaeota archaeon]
MDSRSDFFSRLNKFKVISIIGLAKNVSKTTTLNHIIKYLQANHIIGLTSIGRDGEKYDVITQLPKPRIHINKDVYVVTAEQCSKDSEIEMDLVKKTGFNTPLGEVMIFKTRGSGLIELAGPSINAHISEIIKDLFDLKCDIVLIDGAFDRNSYATPTISDATIISTGASVSEDIHQVISITDHTVKILNLERENNEEIINKSKEIINKAKIGFIRKDNSIKILDLLTALGSAKEINQYLTENVKYIVINGSVTDQLLESLTKSIKKYKSITILVEDATKLFISQKTFYKFKKSSGKIKVLNPIKIIAITVNPTSPNGKNFDKKHFLELLKEKITIPIYDLGPSEY